MVTENPDHDVSTIGIEKATQYPENVANVADGAGDIHHTCVNGEMDIAASMEDNALVNASENGQRNGHSGGNVEPNSPRVKLCRFGRKCTRMELGCAFSHTIVQKPCRFGDRCTKLDACLFIHHAEGRANGDPNYSNSNGMNNIGNWGEMEERRCRMNERERNQMHHVHNGHSNVHDQSAGMAYQMRNGRVDGSFGQSMTHERPVFPHSGVPNSGVFNTGNQNSFGGYSNSPGGQNGLENGFSGEPGGVSTRKVKLCRNGQQCNVNGCTFSHNIINKSCKFGADCHRGSKCLFLHGIPSSHHHNVGHMENNSVNNNGNQVSPKNGYGRAS